MVGGVEEPTSMASIIVLMMASISAATWVTTSCTEMEPAISSLVPTFLRTSTMMLSLSFSTMALAVVASSSFTFWMLCPRSGHDFDLFNLSNEGLFENLSLVICFALPFFLFLFDISYNAPQVKAREGCRDLRLAFGEAFQVGIVDGLPYFDLEVLRALEILDDMRVINTDFSMARALASASLAFQLASFTRSSTTSILWLAKMTLDSQYIPSETAS